MRNRNQRRAKGILPIKVVLGDTTVVLAHTLDISASGVRVVLTRDLRPGATVTVEYKHRRAAGTVVWCRAVKGSKYDHEVGVHLQNAGAKFWGVS